MQVNARSKHLPISPQKLRLVCDKVRGLDALQAVTVLEYMPQKGAGYVIKTLSSAIANAENNHSIDPTTLIVAEIWADEGTRLRRVKAGARGRYKPRVKRLSHLTIVLSQRQ